MGEKGELDNNRRKRGKEWKGVGEEREAGRMG